MLVMPRRASAMAKPVPAGDPSLLELPRAEGDEVHQEAALLHGAYRHLAGHLLDLPALLLGLPGERRALLGGTLRRRLLGPALGADAVQLGRQRLALLLDEGHRRGRIDERVEREVRVDAEQRGDVPLGLLVALEVEGGEAGELVPLDQGRLVHRAAVDAALGHAPAPRGSGRTRTPTGRPRGRWPPRGRPLLGERRRGREEAEGEQAPPAHSGTSLPARVRVAPGITSTVARTLR